VVAHVYATPLASPIGGALRGLTRDGVPVAERTKVIEVDPRGAGAPVAGIGERPAGIADAVAEVVRRWAAGQL
jgi:xanthine dehydrogenase accessory factor